MQGGTRACDEVTPRALPRQPGLLSERALGDIGHTCPLHLYNLLTVGHCNGLVTHRSLKLIFFGETVVSIGPDDEMIEQAKFHELAGRF